MCIVSDKVSLWHLNLSSSAASKMWVKIGSSVGGPSAQYMRTWDLGNSSCSTGFGSVSHYSVFGPLGQTLNPKP